MKSPKKWHYKSKIFWILLLIFLAFLSRTVNELGVNYIEDQKERNNGILIGAEPFFIKNSGDIGVLMLHGYSSSPNDYRELAGFLSEKNITIYTPLLPGHGTHPRDLNKVKAEDYKNYVFESLKKLNTKKKFVIGYSMGGTLALDLASKNDLDGIISINSAIYIKNRYLPFIPLLRLVETYTAKRPEQIVQLINDERVVYDSIPLTSVTELQKLINSISIHEITEPILIFQSDKDDIISPESAEYIFSTIRSEDKKLIVLNNSTHIKINNPEEAFNEIYNFIQEH